MGKYSTAHSTPGILQLDQDYILTSSQLAAERTGFISTIPNLKTFREAVCLPSWNQRMLV